MSVGSHVDRPANKTRISLLPYLGTWLHQSAGYPPKQARESKENEVQRRGRKGLPPQGGIGLFERVLERSCAARGRVFLQHADVADGIACGHRGTNISGPFVRSLLDCALHLVWWG